ncbi:phage tail protein [Bosea sp. Root670]|uniref:phage tail tube protein n=1 Tax=Bosea sp. Root670 TaxID=1736583 RepID=UPI000716301F|nr:phage tail tube protein [Bosea sp. Root670]KRE02596.1 phage tail protein [Bosea sp. Root670]
MPFASGSEVRVAYVPEVTWGTTPATPSFTVIRATSGGLRTNKQTGASDERQADRNVRDEFLLGLGAGGSFEAELTYGTFDDWLEAALCSTWASDVLKNGVTRKSFTVEETLELGATDSFSRFTGAQIGGFSLGLTAREKATLSWEWLAKQETLATAIVAGATYAAPNTNDVMTASRSVAALTLSVGSAKVRSLQLQVANNLRERPVVGSVYSEEFGIGRFDVTGTIEAYFESNALYQAVLDHGSGDLSFTIGDVTAEKYTFELPKIRFGDGSRVVGGNNDDVMVQIPFRGLYDPTETASLKITRAVA